MFSTKENVKIITSDILDNLISKNKKLNSKIINSIISSVIFVGGRKSKETLEFWLLENFAVKSENINYYIELSKYDTYAIKRFSERFASIKYNYMGKEDIVSITMRLAKENLKIIDMVANNLLKTSKYDILIYFMKNIETVNKKSIMLYFYEKSKSSTYYKAKLNEFVNAFPELEKYISLV